MIAPAVMGVDPGTRGAVAVLGSDGLPIYVYAFRPDMTESSMVRLLSVGMRKVSPGDVFVEKVGYKGKSADNPKGDGGQGAFTFGRIAGLISGAVIAQTGEPPRYVTPQAWQGRLGCLSGGIKNVTKAKAAALFPEIKMTHAIADALLIAYYGRLALALDL